MVPSMCQCNPEHTMGKQRLWMRSNGQISVVWFDYLHFASVRNKLMGLSVDPEMDGQKGKCSSSWARGRGGF